MRRIYVLITALALILSLSACTKKEEPVPTEEAVIEKEKWPEASAMNAYDEAEYWNETAGWLYYFTREKFGRSYLILRDPATLNSEEKALYADTLLLTLAYGPSGSTLFTENTEGVLKGDITAVNEAVMELFGFDMQGFGTSFQKDEKYVIEGYDFNEYQPEAVTGAYGLSGNDPVWSGDIAITSNSEWLASQKFDLSLKNSSNGKYSAYTFEKMEITWVDPEECVTTLEARERRDALLSLTTMGKGGNQE